MNTPSKCRSCGSSDLIWFIFRNKGGAQGEPLRMPEIAYDFILVCKECSESLRVLRADDVVEYLTQLLTLPAQQGEGAAFEQKPLEVVGYASPGQIEIVRKVPRTGGMKVKGCKDDRYSEPVVLLSDARRAMISLVARCQREGAFKTCLECGYQDGHDEICQFHAGNRAAQGARVPEGWQLVPVEPTPEMLAAGYDAYGKGHFTPAIIDCYRAMLAAVPAHPAERQEQGEFGDAYQGAREDLAIWKRRALEAEARVRHQDQIIDQMGEDLNAINGPTFMGEPVLPASPAQPEVQRLREALAMFVHMAEYRLLELGILSPEMTECLNKGRAALAARTGQGV